MTPSGLDDTSDLAVECRSEALAGRSLDVIVSGSIGAVESVRFIRSLRRIGATVTPWLTSGGAQFVTPMALAWAAGRETRTAFAGDASHIALNDACIVAPASANLLGKVACGLTDVPASALVASYLGRHKPVLMLPNMHDSLLQAPAVQANLKALRSWGIQFLPARLEEGKQKFPDPATIADEVAHRLNRATTGDAAVLITMGSTRGYIDDVRYLSNYSSGALGSLIAEELYRCGLITHVVAGPSPRRPRVASELHVVATNEEMAAAAHTALSAGASAAVLAASVLDFKPEQPVRGKISSRSAEHLSIALVRTPKIIAGINPSAGVKVGFKLETELNERHARQLAADYLPKYGLSLMVLNDLAKVDGERHQAFLVTPGRGGEPAAFKLVDGKQQVAHAIAAHVVDKLRAVGD